MTRRGRLPGRKCRPTPRWPRHVLPAPRGASAPPSPGGVRAPGGSVVRARARCRARGLAEVTSGPCGRVPIDGPNGYHQPMEHAVGAFHGTSTRTRFVLPGNQHRSPRSGLLRVFRTPTSQAPAMRAAAGRQPVQAIRAATRGAQRPAAAAYEHDQPLLPGRAHMRWSPPRPWVRRPRDGASPPWRG